MKRRKSETMLLKECLHLYIEPRLLRIQPPESLELRAVAYFISASTVLTTGNSYAPKKHHSVSKKHLHRYVAESVFKYNTRGLDDGERTVLAIQNADNKRLTYKQQVGR